jgi:methyl-accepting chemotaxis protein
MNQKQYKSRIFIVDPEFQYGLIRKIAIIGVLIILMSLSFMATVQQLYGDVQIAVAQPNPFAVSENISTLPEQISIFKLLWPVLLICLIVTLAIIFIFGLIISHRMAGPIFRMRFVIEQMAHGDLGNKIRLRKKDDFKSLAATINNLNKSWQMQIKEIKELCQKLEAGDDERQKKIQDQLNEILYTFKTS